MEVLTAVNTVLLVVVCAILGSFALFHVKLLWMLKKQAEMTSERIAMLDDMLRHGIREEFATAKERANSVASKLKKQDHKIDSINELILCILDKSRERLDTNGEDLRPKWEELLTELKTYSPDKARAFANDDLAYEMVNHRMRKITPSIFKALQAALEYEKVQPR